jgi:hypothetical protein
MLSGPHANRWEETLLVTQKGAMTLMEKWRGFIARNRSTLPRLAAVAALALALALPANAAPPAGYLEANIGAPSVSGSTTVTEEKINGNNVWLLAGEGNRFDQVTADQLYFLHKLIRGNGSARGELQERSAGGSQYVGVMVRASLDPNAEIASLIFTTDELARIVRTEKDTLATRTNYGTATGTYPKYMRIQRVGNQVQAFTSTDDRIWDPAFAPVTIPLAETAAIGIAVSSRSQGVVTTARFTKVAIEEGVVSVSGLESAATKNVAFFAWDVVAGAVGYNIYRGEKGATADKFALLKTVAAPLDFFLDESVTTVSKRDLSYVIAPVFNGADNKPFEGYAVRAR